MKNDTRRQMLKKTSLFVIPTIMSFKLSELKAYASGGSVVTPSGEGIKPENPPKQPKPPKK